MKNYFKHGQSFTFFDDETIHETRCAYIKAGTSAALYIPTKHEGPWHDRLVGYRNESSLIHKIESCTTSEEDLVRVESLREELLDRNAYVESRKGWLR